MIERLILWVLSVRWAIVRARHELATRWYCWRHNVIRLAKVIRVHSIRVGNVEQLLGELPGDAFTSVNLRAFAERDWGISIEVENAGPEPVSFMASVFFRSLVTEGLEAISFPPTVLDAKQKRTFAAAFPCAAQVLSLQIPRYTPRPLP